MRLRLDLLIVLEVRTDKGILGISDGMRPLGRPRHKRNHNINTEFQEVGYGAWNGLVGFRIKTGEGLM